MQVTFSDYAKHPGETRVSVYPQFGKPSAYINGDRARKIVLSGDVPTPKNQEERDHMTAWFFLDCIMSMHMDRCVEIDCDLPEELTQWLIAVEHYKGRCHD